MNTSAPLAALALIVVAGCAATPGSPQETAGQVKHMIVCEMNPDAGETPLINATSRLTKLRDVLDVTAGRQATAATQSVAGHRTVTIILTFADEAALARTTADPAYRDVIDHVLRPDAVSVTTSDTVLQNYQVSERFAEETEAATLQRRAAASKVLSEQIRSAK